MRERSGARRRSSRSSRVEQEPTFGQNAIGVAGLTDEGPAEEICSEEHGEDTPDDLEALATAARLLSQAAQEAASAQRARSRSSEAPSAQQPTRSQAPSAPCASASLLCMSASSSARSSATLELFGSLGDFGQSLTLGAMTPYLSPTPLPSCLQPPSCPDCVRQPSFCSHI